MEKINASPCGYMHAQVEMDHLLFDYEGSQEGL